ncbi:hypothetical protein FHX82_000082 [Amycolatopsis bartoniae]|nr:hypothetical protein [Amycolatopsis bartoniae]MBB2933062.1 hypothetical protein [Amycolatopsis bartoniae]TVT11926.1 hypothetical protein FNH07_01005 [Amycolatopsis bartoniae]
MKLALVGGALAATALLSACSGNNSTGQVSPAPATKVTDAAAVQASPQTKAHSVTTGNSGKTGTGDVNCSENGGKVGAPGGPQVDLIAKSSNEGTPGCTEAFNVISEYYAQAPQGEGPGRRVLDILGHWDCAKAEEPAGSQGVVYCNKDGDTALRIETAPSTVQASPQTTGDSAETGTGDVNCSENGGKVGAPGGPQVDLIAKSSNEGTPGCTEAFNVISEYYAQAPQGEGPGRRVLDILGHWDCAKAEEPAGSQGVVYCNKDGDTALRIETAPSN